MSVFGSLFTAVSGLDAQSTSIGMISNNIANVNTVGYKRIDAAFASLVTTEGRATAYAPGSVRSIQKARVSEQGILQQSSSATDVAVSGNGFFVVKSSNTDPLAEPLYTRAGSFSEDASGVLRNSAGYFLQGWPIDQNGNLPASQADISSLQPIDVAFLGGLTLPTTQAALAVNLSANEAQTAYPIASGFTPDFSRSIKVFDSLGEGHDLTINFKKMTSPTATATGGFDLSGITGTFAAHANFSGLEDFDITVGATGPTTINLNGGVAKLLSDINAITDVGGDPVAYAQLDANGFLSIKARNPGEDIILVDGTGSPLGLATKLDMNGVTNLVSGAVDTTPFDPVDFGIAAYPGWANTDSMDISIDGGAPTTVVLANGMTQFLADLNAIPGLSAAVNGVTGFLELTSQQSITIADNSGAPLAGFGLIANTYLANTTVSAPTAPTYLTPLNTNNVINTEGWWTVDFRTPGGAVINEGALNFTGSGALNATTDLNGEVLVGLSSIDWGNGSDAQDINFDLAGFSQFSGQYNVISSTQNGAELGLRTGVAIDEDGFVVAQFSNGQSQQIFKLALATFANTNGLTELSGNVFRESDSSGSFNLREAGTGSAGSIASGALEASNVDLADEFSKMIVTQRAYASNTKVVNTADQMLEELLRLR